MSVISDLPLVSTIAVGLSMAFVCGFIATKLRLSPLVAYLLAGVIIGPYSPGFVADIHIAEQLSEIGIVLLMFGVGLHFSIQDFIEVRKIASFGALIRIFIVTLAGVGISMLWGWGMSTGIIFGLSLSVASTVVLLRALEEHGKLQTIGGKIAIGWLIVEDVAMVLAMVLIPALATSGSGGTPDSTAVRVITALGKAGLFAAIMIIAGRRILPWLLSAVSRTGSRELFTLAAISMAMGIAFGAALLFGVSLALGAFFAGMMIRESDLNHEVADRVLPFQDAFAVLFFVSVGMLFNPAILIEDPLELFLVVSLIIVAKGFITFCIIRLFGYPLRVSLMTATGLAQIGEFSFILMALGVSLNIMPPEAHSLILGGALISIAVNPILINITRKWCDNHIEVATAVVEIDALARLAAQEESVLKNCILLIGKGRVGQHLVAMLDQKNVDLIVVDSNRELVKQLRQKGYHAIAGDATQADTLIEAQIEKADSVLITIPDPFEARRVVELVQRLKPGARILVRSHNDEETAFFNSKSVDLAVSGTEEVARRMAARLSTRG